MVSFFFSLNVLTGSFHLFPHFSSQLNRIDCTCCKSVQQFTMHSVPFLLRNWTLSLHYVHVSSLLWKSYRENTCEQCSKTPKNVGVVWYFVYDLSVTALILAKKNYRSWSNISFWVCTMCLHKIYGEKTGWKFGWNNSHTENINQKQRSGSTLYLSFFL